MAKLANKTKKPELSVIDTPIHSKTLKNFASYILRIIQEWLEPNPQYIQKHSKIS